MKYLAASRLWVSSGLAVGDNFNQCGRKHRAPFEAVGERVAYENVQPRRDLSCDSPDMRMAEDPEWNP